jgi:hypothetical protein
VLAAITITAFIISRALMMLLSTMNKKMTIDRLLAAIGCSWQVYRELWHPSHKTDGTTRCTMFMRCGGRGNCCPSDMHCRELRAESRRRRRRKCPRKCRQDSCRGGRCRWHRCCGRQTPHTGCRQRRARGMTRFRLWLYNFTSGCPSSRWH